MARVSSLDVDAGGLLREVAAGDLIALGQVYDRYRGLAYAVALRITDDSHAAEDVLQEAFLAVWRHADSHDMARGSAKAWVLAIVRNHAINHRRRRRATVGLPSLDCSPERSLTAPDVWSEVARRLDGAAVRAALVNLPVAQREAIELAYFEGLTQQEIAARTGCALGTVKGRVRLALVALRQALITERSPQPAREPEPRRV